MEIAELIEIPFFADLTPAQLQLLAPVFWSVTLGAGTKIFSQGDVARSVYVLVQGDVVLRFFPDDGGSVDIETINANGVFGWSAALGRQEYTSTAICVTPVRAVGTFGVDLRRVMREDKVLAAILLERMAQVLAHRLDSFREQLKTLLDKEEAELI